LSGAHPAQVVSTGAGHLLIEAVSRGAVDRASPDSARLLPVLQAAGGEGAYLYCLDPLHPESGAVAYARFFNPTVGIAEDPATGTAAGPLVAALTARGIVPDGGSAVIEQGHRMGRPSRIRIDVAGPRVRIAGRGLVVADGTLHL
jgi:trans-2,3-dihydro-3-hydroxyanthranilate isomerase